ncbi:uncharacterized protein LAESUDRAFT_415031 [Laetiporus sulphureus 93-53]|uniref:Uncharacterized protein n=1 Tax=Laetiporus sulphureus 93-53 TaxID=1314785 RepID=A0A165C8H7_9APHY|nr:uncharacterized protein LAESUDRAFT_415031 [Laetiporus sulphureus 93-53]KZT02385.1 hypothetical protein LAESUDRAFT_415031 [Laetiporus sulphureus 93-53]
MRLGVAGPPDRACVTTRAVLPGGDTPAVAVARAIGRRRMREGSNASKETAKPLHRPWKLDFRMNSKRGDSSCTRTCAEDAKRILRLERRLHSEWSVSLPQTFGPQALKQRPLALDEPGQTPASDERANSKHQTRWGSSTALPLPLRTQYSIPVHRGFEASRSEAAGRVRPESELREPHRSTHAQRHRVAILKVRGHVRSRARSAPDSVAAGSDHAPVASRAAAFGAVHPTEI